MHRFRNILVAIDADRPAEGLLARAARLAKQNGASIKLIAVVEDLPWYARLVLPAPDELQSLLVRKRSETLEHLAEPLGNDGSAVSTDVLRGRRHIETVRHVLRGGHDLLIKQAEPNEGVLFGSTDMHLLRTCPCSLWLVKPGHGDGPFAQILAPVDPAPTADEADILHIKEDIAPKDPALDAKILELAGSLAEGDGAELHVLHAWSAPVRGCSGATRCSRCCPRPRSTVTWRTRRPRPGRPSTTSSGSPPIGPDDVSCTCSRATRRR
jgi:nucleotide-binding universal stress UspA family protein